MKEILYSFGNDERESDKKNVFKVAKDGLEEIDLSNMQFVTEGHEDEEGKGGLEEVSEYDIVLSRVNDNYLNSEIQMIRLEKAK